MTPADVLHPQQTHVLSEQILAEVERVIYGKRDALELVLMGVLARGHVLLEDLPGLGKTMLARSFAQVLGLTGAEGLIPDSARLYDVKLEWWLDDGEWKLARLDWE